MVRITIFAVLALLVLQSSAQYQRIWYYISDVRVNNVALEDTAAVWGMGARIIGQKYGDDIHCLIETADTALVNGYTGVPAVHHYRNVSGEATAILKPFVVHMGDPTNYTISHEPDDPVWSVNMKRALVSVFMLMNPEEKDVTLQQQTHYGRCDVTHKVTEDDKGNTKIERSINHESCEGSPAFDSGVKSWDPTVGNHKPVTVETTYTYKYNTTPEYLHLDKIETTSLVQYQSTPGVRSIQKVEQTKRYFFQEQSTDVKTFIKIDVSKCTEKANLTFDFSNGYKGGRDDSNPTKSGDELINNFNEEYEKFKEYFDTYPLQNIEEDDNTNRVYDIYDMFDVLYQMKKDTFEKISTEIFSQEDNLYQHMFLSFLPYLGTQDSVKFIKGLVENEDENLNDLLAIKMLSTFPIYLVQHSEELLKEMEPLLSLNVTNEQVKYAGILSFATLLDETFTNEKIDKETFDKYADEYYKHFAEAEDYEVKMTLLLGLVNMQSKLAVESIFEICVNTEISHHLRTLAIYAFKPTLKKSNGADVFNYFWPIVKNHTEHFKVRVAALDLLLYSELSHEDFQTIINWYHDESENPDEQHLANYLYTTVQALENSTGYFEYLGEYATEAFETMKPVKNDRVWTTGNYRMAFTDEEANFGGAIQARLVSDPDSNVVSVGIFSVDTFAVSLNLGSYTAYIAVEGIPDFLFSLKFLTFRFSNPIQHLKDLIKKHGYKLKDTEDAHIEIVIFSDDRVVFGMQVDKNNIDNFISNALLLDVVKLANDFNTLSFPLEESTYIVSDMGTSIKFAHYMSDLASFESKNFNQIVFYAFLDSDEEHDTDYYIKYRSMWTYSLVTESYNPLADASADTYKFVKDEKLVNIPFSFNVTDFVFKWEHKNDSFNWIKDNVLGVYIEEEKLKSYCSYCQSPFNLPVGDLKYIPMKSDAIGSVLGLSFNLTASEKNDLQKNLEKDSLPTSLHTIINSHKTNSFDVPFGKPILYIWHAIMYNTFIDKDLHKVSVRSEPYWKFPTETVFELNYDADDIKNDKDPISGEEFDFTVALTNRRCDNAEKLTYLNITSVYKTKSEAPEGEAQPHIEHSYDIKIFFDEGSEEKLKVCIDREVLYPNRRVDKFSLDPVDPTKASTKIGFGVVEKISDICPTSQYVTVTEIYTATEKQKQNSESLEEYGKCKKQSTGFKYIPPTLDCLEAHKVISQYDASNVYVDLTKLEDVPVEIIDASDSEFGLKVLEYKRLNSTHVTVKLAKQFLSLWPAGENVVQEKTAKVIEDPSELLSLSPSVVAYDDHDLSIGIHSACYITPNEIQTFQGKVIHDYHTEVGQDAVAFVECMNDTLSGLTIQRIGDHHVGFNFWSEDNTVVASAHDGKVKVVYNGKKVSETDVLDSSFKIYFLDQDVIYVTNGLVDIHYTTEYISVKAPSIYNNYICGLCTGNRK